LGFHTTPIPGLTASSLIVLTCPELGRLWESCPTGYSTKEKTMMTRMTLILLSGLSVACAPKTSEAPKADKPATEAVEAASDDGAEEESAEETEEVAAEPGPAVKPEPGPAVKPDTGEEAAAEEDPGPAVKPETEEAEEEDPGPAKKPGNPAVKPETEE
jgi:hypothetical protein